MIKAKDRYGNEYSVGEIVQLIDRTVLWPTMVDRPQEIVEVTEFAACESGFHVLLKDLESGNVWKNKDGSKKAIDTNWIMKINPFLLERFNAKT